MKRLKRSTENKIIFGVCSGLANFLNIDATLVRIVFLLFLLSSFFTAFLIYLACSLIIPADTKIIYQESGNNGKNNSHLRSEERRVGKECSYRWWPCIVERQ